MGPSSRPYVAALTCAAFAAAVVLPTMARAQQPGTAAPDEALSRAKAHFEAGKNAYNAGDYPAAIREFKAAETLRPSPILDYNIGLANEKLGKRRVAVKYYRRYLEGMPNASNRAQVESMVAELERQIAAQPAPSPQPQANTAGSAEQPSDMPPQPTPQQSYSGYDPYGSAAPVQPTTPPRKKNYWWVALIVVGGAALLAGIIAWAVLETTSSVYYYDSARSGLDLPSRAPPPSGDAQRSPGLGPTLFSF